MATSVEPTDLPATETPVAEPQPVAERPVFDADAESEKDKNRRIARELFKDDDETPVAEKPAAPVLPSPPAQRRREQADATPAPKAEPKVDAMGRMHRPDGTVMSKEEQAAASVTPPASQQQAAPSAETPKAADAQPEVQNEPLRFTAYGETVEIPGALYRPGHGVFVPEAGLADFRRTWARGTMGYDRMAADNERLRTENTAIYTRKEAEAQAVLDVLSPFLKSPEDLLAFAQAVGQNPGMVLKELGLDIGRKQLELERTVTAEGPSGTSAPDESEIAEALTDEFTGFLRDPQYGLTGKFTAKEQAELERLLYERAPVFLTTVDRDLDEQGQPVVSANQTVAIRKGEVLVNRAKLLAELRFVAERRGDTTGGTSANGNTVVSSPQQTQQNGQSNGSSTNGAAQSVAPASPARPAPPSAVGRSRASVPAAAQPGTGRRTKDTIPNHSIAAAAKYLFDED